MHFCLFPVHGIRLFFKHSDILVEIYKVLGKVGYVFQQDTQEDAGVTKESFRCLIIKDMYTDGLAARRGWLTCKMKLIRVKVAPTKNRW